jgi:hypothetical protein
MLKIAGFATFYYFFFDYSHNQYQRYSLIMKYIKNSFFFILVIGVVFSIQLMSNPLKKEFADAPEGWSSGAKGEGLAYLVGQFDLISTQLHLKSNDYIRVLRYASESYMRSSYNAIDENNNDAFFELVKNIITDDEFSDKLPNSKSNKSVVEVIEMSKEDGYKESNRFFVRTGSPIDLGVDPALYSWKPDATLGNEYTPYWGELKLYQEYSCEVGEFPIKTYEELLNEANTAAKLTVNMFTDDDSARIRNLLTHFTSPQNSQPGRVLVSVALNYLSDAKFDKKKSDEFLYNLIRAIHDTAIIVYGEKYKYQIAHLSDLSTVTTRQSWLQTRPPFPSEFAAYGEVFTQLVKKYGTSIPVRLEIPASEVSVSSTRVYKDASAFAKELSYAAVLFGHDYLFSLKEGSEIGGCIANEYNYKIFK